MGVARDVRTASDETFAERKEAVRIPLADAIPSTGEMEPDPNTPAAVDLYWLPLGAGGHSVRLNGKVYEALVALLKRRRRFDLYHSALEIRLPEGRFAVESAPVPNGPVERGVVTSGAVGSRWAGRFRIFRYEVRCWRDGVIPDLAEAVESPQRLTQDEDQARRLLDVAPLMPAPVWGRDELKAGEMWNSNSIVAWLLAMSDFDVASIEPPARGRAPGWDAGLVVARRSGTVTGSPQAGRRSVPVA